MTSSSTMSSSPAVSSSAMSIAATSRSGVALKRRGSLRDEDNVLITEERHEVITADVPLLD
jgi:hypothetical protein